MRIDQKLPPLLFNGKSQFQSEMCIFLFAFKFCFANFIGFYEIDVAEKLLNIF